MIHSSRGMTGKTRNPKSPLRPHLRECAAQSRPSDPIFVFAYSRQNTKNPPKSPLRPPQLVPWFLRFIRISALMSKTRVLKCAISMTIMVVIAGQCDHFLPFSTISCHYLPGYLIVHNKKRAKIHFLPNNRGELFSTIFCHFRPFLPWSSWSPRWPRRETRENPFSTK